MPIFSIGVLITGTGGFENNLTVQVAQTGKEYFVIYRIMYQIFSLLISGSIRLFCHISVNSLSSSRVSIGSLKLMTPS